MPAGGSSRSTFPPTDTLGTGWEGARPRDASARSRHLRGPRQIRTADQAVAGRDVEAAAAAAVAAAAEGEVAAADVAAAAAGAADRYYFRFIFYFWSEMYLFVHAYCTVLYVLITKEPFSKA